MHENKSWNKYSDGSVGVLVLCVLLHKLPPDCYVNVNEHYLMITFDNMMSWNQIFDEATNELQVLSYQYLSALAL